MLEGWTNLTEREVLNIDGDRFPEAATSPSFHKGSAAVEA